MHAESDIATLRRPTVVLTDRGRASVALYHFLDVLDTLSAEDRLEVVDLAIRELSGAD